MSRLKIAREIQRGRRAAVSLERESPRPSLAFAVPDFDPSVGGTSRQVGLLGRELARRGYDVKVFTRRRRRSLARVERVDGLVVSRLGPPGYGRLREKIGTLALCLALRRSPAAALVTVQWTDAILAAWAAGLVRRTVVVWAAEGDPADATREDRAMGRLRRSCLRPARHVVLTDAMAEESRRLGLPEPSVIPVPVDRTRFRPPSSEERAAARASFGLNSELVVLYVGHLRALKRVDALVATVPALAQQAPARLLLVGGSRGAEDDVEHALRAQVERLGVADAVQFAGVLEDPRPAYWAADVFVMPSSREGMPNTLVEALACGLACVAPPSAGGAALLANGAGEVAATNDPQDLLRAIVTLLDDPGRRETLKDVGPATIAALDVERVTDMYEQLLREVARQ